MAGVQTLLYKGRVMGYRPKENVVGDDTPSSWWEEKRLLQVEIAALRDCIADRDKKITEALHGAGTLVQPSYQHYDDLIRQIKPICWLNGCLRQAVDALKFLAINERPKGGGESFNAEHLIQISKELIKSVNGKR